VVKLLQRRQQVARAAGEAVELPHQHAVDLLVARSRHQRIELWPALPDALNLDEANRDKLQKVINADPLALIEYWSVDPDYDGEVFRSVWQDYRGNTENDDDAYRVVTTARLTGLPKKEGSRRVCVRVVDVFGFEAEALVEVA